MNEPLEPKSAQADSRPRPIWPIQLMHLGAIALVVLIWELYVPLLVDLPEELLDRIRGYALFVSPVVVAVLVLNHLWLRPLSREWPALVDGVVEPGRAERLMRRAVGYPYLAFLVALIGTFVTAALIALVQAQVHATPGWLVLELLALALALAVVAALLLSLIGRLATAPWLRTPGLVVPRLHWEPDLRKRLVLVVVCVAGVAWLVMGVQGTDRLAHLVASLEKTGDGCGTVCASALGDAFWGLVVGGLACVGLIGLGAWTASKTLSEGPRQLAERIGMLASDTSRAAHADALRPVDRDLVLPVASADEFGDLAAAFNRMTARTTERQRELWRGAERAKGAEARQVEFLATVSSALRTPLHSIIGFSELLLEEVDGALNQEQAEDVRSVRKGGHHLLSLVDDLVDLTRIDTGNLALNLERVELEHVIAEALDAASGLRRHRPIELRFAVADEVPAVQADETRLRQILFNLLGNAFKFTQQGEIWVRAQRDGPAGVRVVVQDSGPGIPDESLQRVFVEFEQVRDQAGDHPKGEGTGLGLAITRRLVELHGGRIEARNRDGGGAEFAFNLIAWEA